MKYLVMLGALILNVWIHPTVLAAGTVELIATHPSDATAFTQGVEVDRDGKLLIGTGLYGESFIGYLDLETGTVRQSAELEKQYFGEGITQTPFGIWQLTWREGTAFLRDAETLAERKRVSYSGEGWGIAYDDERQVVWVSDGSAKLTQRDAETFEEQGELSVTYQGRPVERLNELEYVDGFLYANVWQTYVIVKIDVNTGKVVQQYNMQPIVERAEVTPIERARMDVLNGIAHIEADRFYLFGKRYPVMFEVRLSE